MPAERPSHQPPRRLVSLLDPAMVSAVQRGQTASLGGESFPVADLPDPSSTQQQRPYIVLPHRLNNETTTKISNTSSGNQQKLICEIQSLSLPYYQSMVVGSQVFGDDCQIHLCHPVDPLFWVLSSFPHSGAPQDDQWQPMDQILTHCPPTIVDGMDRHQLQHFFEKMNLQGDEDEDDVEEDGEDYYYKFSSELALQWLSKKQQAIQNVLHQQRQRAKQKMASKQKDFGAFSSGFHLAEEENQPKNQTVGSNNKTKAETQEDDLERAKEGSIQIICNYLNEEWTQAFLSHMSVTSDVLCPPKAGQKRKHVNSEDPVDKTPGLVTPSVDWNVALQQPVADHDDRKSKQLQQQKTAKLSVAAKKLAKVNIKGMKKMSSFFTAKK